MNRLLQILVSLPAILFVVLGLRWIIDPTGAAATAGLTLLEGVGRSTQIGDMGALFLALGIMILIGLVTARRSWFLAPALMLALAAVLRILAWLFHAAALPLDMLGVEVVVSCLLLIASTRLAREG